MQIVSGLRTVFVKCPGVELREAAATFLGKCGSKEIPAHLEVGRRTFVLTLSLLLSWRPSRLTMKPSRGHEMFSLFGARSLSSNSTLLLQVALGRPCFLYTFWGHVAPFGVHTHLVQSSFIFMLNQETPDLYLLSIQQCTYATTKPVAHQLTRPWTQHILYWLM